MVEDNYSTYVDGNLRADVIKKKGDFGCRFYVDNKVVMTEWYPTKSESWAEDCAENYVLGIKKI
jgi:hypothetical protein